MQSNYLKHEKAQLQVTTSSKQLPQTGKSSGTGNYFLKVIPNI